MKKISTEPLLAAHTYIAHVSSGCDNRRTHTQQLMARHGITNSSWMLDGDIATLTAERLTRYFAGSRQCRDAANSCAMKHIMIYEDIVKNNYDIVLVLEDDMFFTPNFNTICNQCCREILHLPNPNLIVSLENSNQQFVPKRMLKPDTCLYEAPAGRCTGAYLITLEGAKSILLCVADGGCVDAIDWYHNRLIARGDLLCYWCAPTIAEQGSHNGRIPCSLGYKPHGLTRRAVWRMQIWMKTMRNRYSLKEDF